jgi:hypothetical protein
VDNQKPLGFESVREANSLRRRPVLRCDRSGHLGRTPLVRTTASDGFFDGGSRAARGRREASVTSLRR